MLERYQNKEHGHPVEISDKRTFVVRNSSLNPEDSSHSESIDASSSINGIGDRQSLDDGDVEVKVDVDQSLPQGVPEGWIDSLEMAHSKGLQNKVSEVKSEAWVNEN